MGHDALEFFLHDENSIVVLGALNLHKSFPPLLFLAAAVFGFSSAQQVHFSSAGWERPSF